MSAPSGQTSKKRPPELPPSGAQRKRQRLNNARQIAAAMPSLSSGVLDVSSFVASRQYEIDSFIQAMASSKKAGSKRAFQSVPRDMRRRTASHNPARVPQRLRRRAKQEMLDDNTPLHTMRKHKKSTRQWVRKQTQELLQKAAKKKEVLGKTVPEFAKLLKEDALRQPPRPHSKYRKRQRNKTWLSTHIWHAKRAHMGVRWRFAIAESTNEKSYRKTARAADGISGAVAWDMSYLSSILMRGQRSALEIALKELTGGLLVPEKVKEGKRVWEVWGYAHGGYPQGAIAPVIIIWDPPPEAASPTLQQVLVQVHPCAFLVLWNTLLALARPTDGTSKKLFTLEDLRFEIGSIHLTGPTATSSLISACNPSQPSAPASLFAKLAGLSTPSALPPNVVISFTIADPRLHYPPRMPPVPGHEPLFTTTSTFSPPLNPHQLLSRPLRSRAVKLQASDKRISKRKRETLPGDRPSPLPNDPHIPVILFATGDSWTILMPWKWVKPFWWCLQETRDMRFGGLTELRQSAFEQGRPWFPADFPGTASGLEWDMVEGAERKLQWGRRPPAKRVAYERVRFGGQRGEEGDWWRCDWTAVFGPAPTLPPHPPSAPPSFITSPQVATGPTTTTPSSLPSQPPPPPQSPQPPPVPQPWQIPRRLLSSPTLPPLGIVAVKISLIARGSPKNLARVYLPPPGTLAEKWTGWTGGEKLVGFVTTGNFCIAMGRPVAIAAVAWETVKARKGKERWVILRDVGGDTGRVGRWEVVG